jgi:hypothetical protein
MASIKTLTKALQNSIIAGLRRHFKLEIALK